MGASTYFNCDHIVCHVSCILHCMFAIGCDRMTSLTSHDHHIHAYLHLNALYIFKLHIVYTVY